MGLGPEAGARGRGEEGAAEGQGKGAEGGNFSVTIYVIVGVIISFHKVSNEREVNEKYK